MTRGTIPKELQGENGSQLVAGMKCWGSIHQENIPFKVNNFFFFFSQLSNFIHPWSTLQL